MLFGAASAGGPRQAWRLERSDAREEGEGFGQLEGGLEEAADPWLEAKKTEQAMWQCGLTAHVN